MPCYEVTLTRYHPTETVNRPGHRPRELFQVARFTVESLLDFFNLEASEVLHAVRNVIPEQPGPVDGWDPWSVLRVSESYEPPAPAPLVLPEGSLAAKLLQFDLARYPHFNGNDEFAPYRVLAKWFVCNGSGFHWDDIGQITDYKTAQERADSLADFQTRPPEPPYQPYEFEIRRGNPDVWPTVGLHGFSTLVGNLPNLPTRVEDSFLLALHAFLVYVLTRPVWENTADVLDELLNLQTQEQKDAFWKSDEWRAVMLANGAKYRAHMEAAYEALHNSLNGVRLREMGFVEDRLLRWDARLPPKVKLFY